jgi:hypothetical protein
MSAIAVSERGLAYGPRRVCDPVMRCITNGNQGTPRAAEYFCSLPSYAVAAHSLKTNRGRALPGWSY